MAFAEQFIYLCLRHLTVSRWSPCSRSLSNSFFRNSFFRNCMGHYDSAKATADKTDSITSSRRHRDTLGADRISESDSASVRKIILPVRAFHCAPFVGVLHA